MYNIVHILQDQQHTYCLWLQVNTKFCFAFIIRNIKSYLFIISIYFLSRRRRSSIRLWQLEVRFLLGELIIIYEYFHISWRWVQHTMPRKFDEKWRMEYLNNRFSLPILVYAKYSVKLIYLFYFINSPVIL